MDDVRNINKIITEDRLLTVLTYLLLSITSVALFFQGFIRVSTPGYTYTLYLSPVAVIRKSSLTYVYGPISSIILHIPTFVSIAYLLKITLNYHYIQSVQRNHDSEDEEKDDIVHNNSQQITPEHSSSIEAFQIDRVIHHTYMVLSAFLFQILLYVLLVTYYNLEHVTSLDLKFRPYNLFIAFSSALGLLIVLKRQAVIIQSN